MGICIIMYREYRILHIGMPSPEQQMLVSRQSMHPRCTSQIQAGATSSSLTCRLAASLCFCEITVLQDVPSSAPHPFPVQSTCSCGFVPACICVPHKIGILYMMARRGCPANKFDRTLAIQNCLPKRLGRKARKPSTGADLHLDSWPSMHNLHEGNTRHEIARSDSLRPY
jgi:hypothetical protein